MKWPAVQLNELCEFKGGLWKGVKPPFAKAKVLRITNFTKDCELDPTDAIELDVEARQLEKRRLADGDIIIEKSGGGPNQPVGRVALCEGLEGVYSFSNFTTAIRVNDQRKVNPRYLHKFLKALYLRGETEAMQSNSTNLRNLNLDAYKSIQVPVPPLPEQQRIVGKLDAAFAALAEAQGHVERNRANARELFESYLNGVFEGKNWPNHMLGDVARIRTGKVDANHQRVDGPYVFYTCAIDQMKSPTWSFEGPSIILPGNGANVGVTFFFDGRFEAYQRTYVVNEFMRLANPRFVYYCFRAAWKNYIATRQFGSATNYIVLGDLKQFPVPLPDLAEQERCLLQFEEAERNIVQLETTYAQKLTELEGLKKAVLGAAFNGNL